MMRDFPRGAVARALVVANGELDDAAVARTLDAEADLVVAADGGAGVAIDAGILPHAVVGDLDSLGELRRLLRPDQLFPYADPEHTDLEKAIAFAITRGAKRVDVVAAGGGRADHAFANLSVLRTFAGRADVRVHDHHFEIRLVRGEVSIDAEPGTVVSLVAVGLCEGVWTSGLRWPLLDESLEFSPRGIHNEVETRPATVSVRSGDLLLFQGRWVERHI